MKSIIENAVIIFVTVITLIILSILDKVYALPAIAKYVIILPIMALSFTALSRKFRYSTRFRVYYFMCACVILQFLLYLLDDSFFFRSISIQELNENREALTVVNLVSVNFLFLCQLFYFFNGKISKQYLVLEFAALILFISLNIVLFANYYYNTGLSFKGDIVNDFNISLYFSIVTWTTLGYGDVLPHDSNRLIASIQALVGYVYMAILIGLILSFSHNQKTSQN
ncbi:hypothetical protein HG263_05525 [Pseudoalteromonas sp. JBTF-M23]|uniref:Potassium channel domain-containing protein n=1 Tax=Pseudoalteromonas caenipelagi TaxID=2726988 RepID=A0A849V9S6_9GAMM|nr:potassium channel family protein [Pseudoalteromonas caenipelagi]NOU49996.1 hypothetical protein [Pseudoalteromonas caenipelagi]